jgi:hypothetical protein
MGDLKSGTTKLKKKRRTRADIDAERAAQAQSIAQIEKAKEEVIKKGGQSFTVHSRRGRFHSTHTVVVTKGGRIFFPDHGMCDAHALIADVDMRQDRGGFDLSLDACHALALYLLRPHFHLLTHVPFIDSNWRRRPDPNGMTKWQKEWWSLGAWEYIRSIQRKRVDRLAARKPSQDATTRGISFQTSMFRRMTAIRTELDKRLGEKIARVQRRLKAAGHKQLDTYREF